MSETYHFGTGTGKVSAATEMAIDKKARAHGATFVYLMSEHRYWFNLPDQGEPFDHQRADYLLGELAEAGLWPLRKSGQTRAEYVAQLRRRHPKATMQTSNHGPKQSIQFFDRGKLVADYDL
jgi:hypothetical protein